MQPKNGAQNTLGDEGKIAFTIRELREIKRRAPKLVRIVRRFVASVEALSSSEAPPLVKKTFLEHYGLRNGLRTKGVAETAGKMGLTEHFAREFIKTVWSVLEKSGTPMNERSLERISLALFVAREILGTKVKIVPTPADKPLRPEDSAEILDHFTALPQGMDESERRPCPREAALLLRSAVDVTGYPLELILSKARPQALADLRFALMHVMRTDLKMVYEDIKDALGRDDHGGAIHGCKRAGILLEQSGDFRNLIAKIRARYVELAAIAES